MGMKPAALTAVNGKYPLDGAGRVPSRLDVPVWDSGRVHPACNTRFEFDWKARGHLDKTMISQHAGDVLHHSGQSDSGSTGLDWGWS
jgi:hypothetical protein